MPTANKHFPSSEIVCGLPRLEYYRRYNAARKEKSRAWKLAHPRTHEMRAAEYTRSREKNLADKRRAYEENPDKFRAAAKDRKARRTEEERQADNAYQKNYRSIHGRILNKKKLEKINASAELKVLRALRGRINVSIARAKRRVEFVKKCAATSILIGCSIGALIEHIQRQFLPGMTWKNHGPKGWHIDHILPCASFDMTDEDQQRQCFHYTNLQPLWAADNLRKKDKLPSIKLPL